MQHVQELIRVMAALRDRDSGCPWDREQTFASLVPHTIEEAYEVADVIEREAYAELKGELGDLLFQVVFYAELAKEQGWFDFDDVAAAITEKLVSRHPHVFADTVYSDLHEQTLAWESLKREERAARGESVDSSLDGISLGQPGLSRAHKLQKRAAQVGFDWSELAPVLDKISEELEEVRSEIDTGAAPDRVEHEVGDLLFSCVNLARKLKVDPEQAVRGANQRFELRFRAIEGILRDRGTSPSQTELAEMDRLWDQVKQQEPR
jgi:MazG family protein